MWSLAGSLPVVAFVDVLQRIEVYITVISRRNLDTVRYVDRFCTFGDTHASNCYERWNIKTYFLIFIGASVYDTEPFSFVSKCNADRSR